MLTLIWIGFGLCVLQLVAILPQTNPTSRYSQMFSALTLLFVWITIIMTNDVNRWMLVIPAALFVGHIISFIVWRKSHGHRNTSTFAKS